MTNRETRVRAVVDKWLEGHPESEQEPIEVFEAQHSPDVIISIGDGTRERAFHGVIDDALENRIITWLNIVLK